MDRPFSLAPWIILTSLATIPLGAQAPPAGSDDAAWVASLEAEIEALQALSWVSTGSISASIGWRDNVMLSPFHPIDRAFGRGELGAILFRPKRRGWEFVALLDGDVLRYFSAPPDTAGEQQWTLHSEFRWSPTAEFRLTAKAVGYWQDSMIDLSDTETVRLVSPLQLRGGLFALSPRFALPAGFQLEPTIQAKVHDYRDYAGDYQQLKGGARLEWKHSSALTVTATGLEAQRDYDQRTHFTAGGRPLPATRLQFRQSEAELKACTTWGTGLAWSLSADAGWLKNRDGNSGYFDYTQKHAGLDLGWQQSRWRVNATTEATRTDYHIQTVGAGLSPPARLGEDYEIAIRVERMLRGQWKVFVDQSWERSRSNEPNFNYRANTVMTGIERSF